LIIPFALPLAAYYLSLALCLEWYNRLMITTADQTNVAKRSIVGEREITVLSYRLECIT